MKRAFGISNVCVHHIYWWTIVLSLNFYQFFHYHQKFRKINGELHVMEKLTWILLQMESIYVF